MKVSFQCPACQNRFQAPQSYAGRKARCPMCSAVITIPAPKLNESAAAVNAHEPSSNDSPANEGADHELSTETADDSVPQIITRPSAKVPKPPEPARRAGGKRKLPRWGVAALIVGAVFLCGFAGAELWWLRQATLVIKWPVLDRRGATLTVDDREQNVPAKGNVEFRLSPGKHKLVFSHLEYQSIVVDVPALGWGETKTVSPDWSKWQAIAEVAGFQEWTQNFEEALRLTTSKKKSLLVAFSAAANREGPVHALCADVLTRPQFEQLASKQFVRVVFDFDSSELESQRRAQEYAIEVLPTRLPADGLGRARGYNCWWPRMQQESVHDTVDARTKLGGPGDDVRAGSHGRPRYKHGICPATRGHLRARVPFVRRPHV